MIHDVLLKSLRQIHDERGKVMHMLRCDDPHYSQFGEIYFSTSYPGVVKAWHCHREMTLNYAVVSGYAKIVLFDSRVDSPSNGVLMEVYSSPEDYNQYQFHQVFGMDLNALELHLDNCKLLIASTLP